MPLRLCFALLLGGLGTAAARGQVTFTFSGKAQSTALGYNLCDVVTFSITVTSNFANNGSSAFGGEGNSWGEEYFNESQLFVTVTGAGLTGSFSRPGGSEIGFGDPYSYLDTYGSKELDITIGTDGGNGFGLTLPSAALVQELDVYIDVNSDPSPFTTLPCYGDPATYFSALAGTYDNLCSSTLTLYDPDWNSVDFKIDSMTISAIPEPSTGAALFGVAALGLVSGRRLLGKKLKP